MSINNGTAQEKGDIYEGTIQVRQRSKKYSSYFTNLFPASKRHCAVLWYGMGSGTLSSHSMTGGNRKEHPSDIREVQGICLNNSCTIYDIYNIHNIRIQFGMNSGCTVFIILPLVKSDLLMTSSSRSNAMII